MLTLQFKVLTYLAIVLLVMHRNDWVHRDVSYGNVMLDEQGHVRLIDFEYAKKTGDPQVPETRDVCSHRKAVRTHRAHIFSQGTKSFMAVEAKWANYQYQPRMFKLCPWEIRSIMRDRGEPVEYIPTRHSSLSSFDSDLEEFCTPQPVFNFNQLHDLESLWWLTSYFVFDWAEAAAPQDTDDPRRKRHLAKQRTLARDLFNACKGRTEVMEEPGSFAESIRCLHGNCRLAGKVLERWRCQLVDRYLNTDQDFVTVLYPDFEGLHGKLIDSLKTIIELTTAPEPELQVLPPAEKNLKHARDAHDVEEAAKKQRAA